MPEPLTDATPTCFRHPDRETYVSCVRCGRHACHECMRSASVGQQCVECVREGGRTMRAARTAFGGRPAASAPVTWALVAINVAVFLIALAQSSTVYNLDMVGAYVATGQWYRLMTSAFEVPGIGLLGFGDILFNMWALVYIGPALEGMLGHVRYLALYLLSALGGSVFYYWVVDPGAPAAGASGAIFGLFGAWFVISKRLRLDTRWIVTLIVLNLVFSFSWARIAWQDHIGGLITGVLVTAAYAYAPRKNRTLTQVAASVAVLAILVAAAVLRTHQIHIPPG